MDNPNRYALYVGAYGFGTRTDDSHEEAENGDWMKAKEVLPLIEQLRAALAASEQSEPTFSETDKEWFDRLWTGYPKSLKHQPSVPMSVKRTTMERFKRSMTKHKLTSEQVVMSISRYVQDANNKQFYIPSLQVLLGNEKAYWVNYIEAKP